MRRYEMSEEEMAYLAQYDITRYERPSVAADMTIFSIMEEGKRENFRKLPKKALKLLLVCRGTYPYKGAWALPGGFCRPGEDVCETARRELYEETNIEKAYLSPVGIFGETDRDPRGWIISNTFLALVDAKKCRLRAGSDVGEAKWFSVRLKQQEVKKEVKEDFAEMETEYELCLVHEESDTELSAKVKEYKQFRDYHETVRYESSGETEIAFDHAKIILHALLQLRKNVENEPKQVFDLMPELFTLTQLQNAFELILDRELLTANFRRKIADYVIETEQVYEGMGHRPAKLFGRNVKEFYR